MKAVKVWVVKRRRKKGLRYAVQWLSPQTGQTRTEAIGPDKAYARHRAAQLRQELTDGLYRDTKPITYAEFVQEHLTQLEGTHSRASWVEHALVLRQFDHACHATGLAVIDYAMLEKFRAARLADGVSPATVNKSLRTLQAILEAAVRRGYLKANPFHGKRQALFIRTAEPTPTTLRPVEFQQLLAACPDDRWRALVFVAYHAGLRRGEILALEWDDIDFEAGTILVKNTIDHVTKSRKNRTVPASVQLLDALRALQLTRLQGPFVFKHSGGGRLIHNVHKQFAEIVVKAGLTDGQGKARYSLHDLRRSCATELLNRGISPKVVQAILGHASYATTMRYYAGVEARDMKAAIDRLSAQTA